MVLFRKQCVKIVADWCESRSPCIRIDFDRMNPDSDLGGRK